MLLKWNCFLILFFLFLPYLSLSLSLPIFVLIFHLPAHALVRLTTSLPTLATLSSSSTAETVHQKHQQQQRATTTMQNRTILQYTGDFFVESVSLISSKERGSFVTSTDATTTDDNDNADADASEDYNSNTAASSSDETLGNKLPISWFDKSQYTMGNRQLKNTPNAQRQTNADALTRNVYNSDASIMPEVNMGRQDYDKNETGKKLERFDVETVDEKTVDSIQSNGFFKATKNVFKLKQRQLQQQKDQQEQQQEEEQQYRQHTTNIYNNKWYSRDNAVAEDSLATSSSSSIYGSSKKRKKSVEIENSNICSSENKWRGKTKSNTNAAGGISTESLGLWLVNELCEQNDTIEFR